MSRAQRKPSTVGDILLEEYLIPLNLKIADLAEMLDVHRNTASAIVNNNTKLSLEMALKLARLFNTSPEFWLNLQMKLDLWEIGNNVRFQESLKKISPIARNNLLENIA
ncbi:TPA: HigA family addiction module antidote protein [Pasteurella multocida]|nr:HigA family addiction module antidote protein [Pasteurella multocida]